ncbi:MAG: sigma-70 family RNA polymerase sigma factor [Lachnospiraceae bacterium]|nr:sigma-70 family RNA polymerase sigma factor [Lachnospiraceae bacterium]
MAEEYGKCSDEELIARIRAGERDIADYLCGKYKDAVRARSQSMFLQGGDRDDLIQEGMIGLYKAIRDFDENKDASFSTFAGLCITRQMQTAIEGANRKKHTPLNTAVSIFSEGREDSENPMEALEFVEDKREINPEEVLIDRENVENLEGIIDEELSVFEREVLILHMGGFKLTEIAKRLSKDDKSIDNALQRIKNKIRRKLVVDN